MRISETPAPTGRTSPGFPAARRVRRTRTRAAARQSLSLVNHRSNVADLTTSTLTPATTRRRLRPGSPAQDYTLVYEEPAYINGNDNGAVHNRPTPSDAPAWEYVATNPGAV